MSRIKLHNGIYIFDGEEESVSTSTQKEARFDPGSFDDIREALRIPETERIEAVVITDYVFENTRGTLDGRKYLLISRKTWEEVKTQVVTVSIPPVALLAGIPILDDEELARRIILSIIDETIARIKKDSSDESKRA